MSLLDHCSRTDKDGFWQKRHTVDEMIEGLLTKEAQEKPSDTEDPDKLDIQLPEWFDENEFNKGRSFYWDNSFALSTSMLVSLIAVFSVPSILRVLMASRRSSSSYTAYKRYLSTILHTLAWFENELKPGSISWRSLLAVRRRHYRAGLSSKAHGTKDIVSQRDVALTQFGFFGFSMLKPDKFGIRQRQEGGWEAYNHFWRVIGYMLGLEDRYNICRNTVEETRQVCQHLLERVYTPCLENVPEHFEHMARVMTDGMSCIIPMLDTNATLYYCRLLGDVPGYVYTEEERIAFQKKLQQKLKGKTIDTGVDVSSLMKKSTMDDLPDLPPRHLYLRDFETMETVPAYKKLTFYERLNLSYSVLIIQFYSTYLGNLYFNLQHKCIIFLSKYFPYIGFIRFGIKNAYVDIFVESPKDDTKVKKNIEYYNAKPVPWYRAWLSLLW